MAEHTITRLSAVGGAVGDSLKTCYTHLNVWEKTQTLMSVIRKVICGVFRSAETELLVAGFAFSLD